MLFEKCPTLQCDELNRNIYSEIKAFYNSTYKSSYICRKIFDVVCSVDKTLLTLIAGSLTSLSINLATSFIDMKETVMNAEFVFRLLQFFFAAGFNIYTIRFAAKVISIQDIGKAYIPSERAAIQFIKEAQKNIMFYACMDNEKYLRKCIVFGGICIMITIFSIFFNTICVEYINQIILFISNLYNDIINEFYQGVYCYGSN